MIASQPLSIKTSGSYSVPLHNDPQQRSELLVAPSMGRLHSRKTIVRTLLVASTHDNHSFQRSRRLGLRGHIRLPLYLWYQQSTLPLHVTKSNDFWSNLFRLIQSNIVFLSFLYNFPITLFPFRYWSFRNSNKKLGTCFSKLSIGS